MVLLGVARASLGDEALAGSWCAEREAASHGAVTAVGVLGGARVRG